MITPDDVVRCEMFRKLRGGFKNEDGFSVLEVVLAAFILFFVLTAVLGLVATSTRMGLSARQRVATTNAVSSHLEWVRSLSFDQVALYPDGQIDPETVMTIGDFTVTITTQVAQQGTTKEISITALATAPNYRDMEMTTFTALRDSDAGITQMMNVPDAPEVDYNAPTPAEDTVLYGAYLVGGSPLYISAHAEAFEDDGVIADIRMYCSGTLLRDGSTIFANVAAWQPLTHDVDKTFRWDTRQVDDQGNLAVADGWRIVRTVATDDRGLQAVAERRFYVDNYPPDNPGPPAAQINNDVETRVSWTSAKDGTDPAIKYWIRWSKVDSAGALGPVNNTFVTSPVFLHTTTAFSRYNIWIASGSPRTTEADAVYLEIQKPYVSRPLLSGTSVTRYDNMGKEERNNRTDSYTTVNLGTNAPTFAVGSIQYDVFRSDNPETIKSSKVHAANVGATFSEEYKTDVGLYGVPTPYYYAYRVTFTPSGYAGPGGTNTSEVVWSSVVGPATALTTSQQMAHYSW